MEAGKATVGGGNRCRRKQMLTCSSLSVILKKGKIYIKATLWGGGRKKESSRLIGTEVEEGKERNEGWTGGGTDKKGLVVVMEGQQENTPLGFLFFLFQTNILLRNMIGGDYSWVVRIESGLNPREPVAFVSSF